MLVLAGGKGTRMGGPKVLMDVGGKPWWRVQMDRLAATGIEQTWVVSPATRLALDAESSPPKKLVHADENEPMFGSLIRGIRSLDVDRVRGVFVLPIDVPAPDATVWQALSSAGQCAVPTFQSKRGHPIYLPTNWVRTHLLQDPLSENSRLDTLVRHDRIDVEVHDPCATTNLNTPDDVALWLETMKS